MPSTELTDGSPVPEDRSHTDLLPSGQQRGYVVLSPEERAQGFVKPVRRSYVHGKCGQSTKMALSIAETYARDPHFYSGTYCVGCGSHFPLDEFSWEDGEPMEPKLQDGWQERRKQARIRALVTRIEQLQREIDAAKAERDAIERAADTTADQPPAAHCDMPWCWCQKDRPEEAR